MSIVNMERITWKEIDNLDKDKSVIFVALSPIEEHGRIYHWELIIFQQRIY